ncbi:TRAP transporter large permease subunit [Ideonella livida]|uniref:TRAP transporter large permease subunit n=1 Tax=Ideonella livida TaxID=2707176 RepID=A0A7C9TGQ6_9BURK|nr:TRAP transporter large permease subunit [Ideonella livida]NDY89840.1 TRAP transporter large permease subunit [Ideonella livida]
MSPVAPAQPTARPPWPDEVLAGLALALMVGIPLAEMLARPLLGAGVQNASVLVQHLGLLMTMAGALAAERHGHLSALGSSLARWGTARVQAGVRALVLAGTGTLCGLLAGASARLVQSEMQAPQPLAYGMAVWWVQAAMPLGFAWLGLQFTRRVEVRPTGWALPLRVLPALGAWAAWSVGGMDGAGPAAPPLLPGALCLLVLLLAGAPVFAILGGLALLLFWHEGLPLASVALSHYQITVNASLPALPLYTLAGLVLARTQAAQRLSALFVALFGGGARGTVVAAALLCSAFTAFTGGSGVTILALGGLLLPLLRQAGYPEQRGIGLVTSASALGVLLAPSVPLILYAVIARVPIAEMFLAGVVPALLMVVVLLVLGGFLRRDAGTAPAPASAPDARAALRAAWIARWELAAPAVALGSLLGGWATPVESAALTAAYALFTQAVLRRELGAAAVGRVLAESAQIIGGVMLILGMALALTNFLVDAGIPDLAVDWVQSAIPDRTLFLVALCAFLFVAAALMEIYAAIVVLVPLLLPLARAYGLDPLHFGIIFLAAMEAGFLCPPAGMNLYFASAMFRQPLRTVAVSVLPAMGAIFVGTVLIALVPPLATGLPALLRP